MRLLIFICFTFPLLLHAQDCNTLTANFSSYVQAVEKIEASKFQIQETLNTYSSSWIKRIEYYSCDKQTGYLIMITLKGKNYLYHNVPKVVWDNWKNANSYGSYYQQYIKGKYRFEIKE